MHTMRKSTRLKSIARVFLATILLLGFVASTLPLESIASGPLCTLSCCAGRAPHAAGSCMNGSCHAFLGKDSSHHRAPVGTQVNEQLCGLARAVRRNLALANSTR